MDKNKRRIRRRNAYRCQKKLEENAMYRRNCTTIFGNSQIKGISGIDPEEIPEERIFYTRRRRSKTNKMIKRISNKRNRKLAYIINGGMHKRAFDYWWEY